MRIRKTWSTKSCQSSQPHCVCAGGGVGPDVASPIKSFGLLATRPSLGLVVLCWAASIPSWVLKAKKRKSKRSSLRLCHRPALKIDDARRAPIPGETSIPTIWLLSRHARAIRILTNPTSSNHHSVLCRIGISARPGHRDIGRSQGGKVKRRSHGQWRSKMHPAVRPRRQRQHHPLNHHPSRGRQRPS